MGVNQLKSLYQIPSTNVGISYPELRPFIISKFVLDNLIFSLISDEFVDLATAFAISLKNLAFHSWIFELNFLSRLKGKSILLKDTKGNEVNWSTEKFKLFTSTANFSSIDLVCLNHLCSFFFFNQYFLCFVSRMLVG